MYVVLHKYIIDCHRCPRNVVGQFEAPQKSVYLFILQELKFFGKKKRY